MGCGGSKELNQVYPEDWVSDQILKCIQLLFVVTTIKYFVLLPMVYIR